MNRIITIGRQFGSGGREFGKRLSDELGFAYYDKEIVTEIAKRTQLAETYVQSIMEKKPNTFFPITTARTLHMEAAHINYLLTHQTAVFSELSNLLHELAQTSDCVIVGCSADYLLKEYSPLRIFVYADIDARIARCRQKGEEPDLSDRALRKKILTVDKNRAKHYKYYTGHTWGARQNYDICVNTTIAPIKELAHSMSLLISNKNTDQN